MLVLVAPVRAEYDGPARPRFPVRGVVSSDNRPCVRVVREPLNKASSHEEAA
jgi:hypothetical protein